jgi:hypothetical protein
MIHFLKEIKNPDPMDIGMLNPKRSQIVNRTSERSQVIDRYRADEHMF